MTTPLSQDELVATLREHLRQQEEERCRAAVLASLRHRALTSGLCPDCGKAALVRHGGFWFNLFAERDHSRCTECNAVHVMPKAARPRRFAYSKGL